MSSISSIFPTGTIKSIQRFTISVSCVANGTSSLGSGTATISAVDTSKAVLYLLGFGGDSGNMSGGNCRLTFTNSTTITANVASSYAGANTVNVSGQVVEYY